MRKDASESAKFGLIEELSLSEPTAISRIQVKDGIKLRAAVEVAPGNASSADERVLMETREFSPHRVRVIGTRPPRVGDVYELRFDRDVLSIADTYALCVSCRLLPGREYEGQFELFTPLDLNDIAAGQ